MPMKIPITFDDLLERGQYSEIARRLLNHEIENEHIELSELRENPFVALERHPNLRVVYESTTGAECSVAGYFRADTDPAELVVNSSGLHRRDSFTVLHEYGHYVQAAHPEWPDTLHMQENKFQDSINERVADEFAAEVLFPASTLVLDPSTISAIEVREAFIEHPSASRSALVHRIVSLAHDSDDLMIAVITDNGSSILLAKSTGNLMSPARDIDQPSLRNLAKDASRSSSKNARGNSTHNFLKARSGVKQTNIRLEVALDNNGYGFAVARRATRFGTPRWTGRPVKKGLCSNPSCDQYFEIRESLRECSKCREWSCPYCLTCHCDPTTLDFCNTCGSQLTPGEKSGIAEHECFV